MTQTKAAGSAPPKKYLSVRQAAFIGAGAMVGAGIFALLGAAHFRVRSETGASVLLLSLAILASAAVLVTFVFTTLIHEPASIVTLLAILLLGVGLDYGWKRKVPR